MKRRTNGKRGARGARRAIGVGGDDAVVPHRPPVATRHLEALEAHVERHVGPIAFVAHETHSTLVHLDVLAVAPAGARERWTLVTSGMSDAPMRWRCAAGHVSLRYAELTLCLPPDWTFAGHDGPRSGGWPLRLLVDMARGVHARDTFYACGHTWQRRGYLAPQVPFVGAVFVPPAAAGGGFEALEVAGRPIDLLGVCLLRRDEVRFKLRRGLDALIDALGEGATERFRPERASVVPRGGSGAA